MASDARKTEWEREIAEQAVRDARTAFADRLAKAERQRDEARAALEEARDEARADREVLAKVACERDKARADLYAERSWAVQHVRERNVAQSQAARYRAALERIAEWSGGNVPAPETGELAQVRAFARGALRGGDGHE